MTEKWAADLMVFDWCGGGPLFWTNFALFLFLLLLILLLFLLVLFPNKINPESEREEVDQLSPTEDAESGAQSNDSTKSS